MVNNKGFTILEMMISVTLFLVVVMASTQILSSAHKSLFDTEKNISNSQDLILIEGLLKSAVSLSHFKSYALNGGQNANNAFTQFLFPQHSVCSNLKSHSKCNASSTLVFSSLDHKNLIKSLAYCWIDEGLSLMVDSNIASLIQPNNVFALTSAPVSSFWEMKGQASNININTLPSDCFNYLDRNGSNYITNNRRRINVAPVILPGGNTNAANTIKTKMAQSFPININKVQLYSAGLLNSNNTSDPIFSIQKCEYKSGLNCNSTVFFMPHMQQVNITESFNIRLSNNPNRKKYYLTGTQVNNDPSYCVAPECVPMNLTNNNNLRYFYSGETSENLNESFFSGFKQDFVSNIEILLTNTEGKRHTISLPVN